MNSIEERRETYESRIEELSDITFVGWQTPFRNNTTRAIVRHSCGYEWAPVVASLFAGKGCPKCSKRVRPSPDEYEARINNSGIHTFVSWCSSDRSARARVVVRCKMGHDIEAALYNITGSVIKCPTCNKKKRLTEAEHIARINALVGVSFVEWVAGYHGSASKFVCLHSCGSTTVTMYGDAKRGGCCPACTKHGYKDGQPGYLYHLKSICGAYIKVGITNNMKKRLQELVRLTPFGFEVSSVRRFDSGLCARRREAELHASMKSAGFSGFSGASEWFLVD